MNWAVRLERDLREPFIKAVEQRGYESGVEFVRQWVAMMKETTGLSDVPVEILDRGVEQ